MRQLCRIAYGKGDQGLVVTICFIQFSPKMDFAMLLTSMKTKEFFYGKLSLSQAALKPNFPGTAPSINLSKSSSTKLIIHTQLSLKSKT